MNRQWERLGFLPGAHLRLDRRRLLVFVFDVVLRLLFDLHLALPLVFLLLLTLPLGRCRSRHLGAARNRGGRGGQRRRDDRRFRQLFGRGWGHWRWWRRHRARARRRRGGSGGGFRFPRPNLVFLLLLALALPPRSRPPRSHHRTPRRGPHHDAERVLLRRGRRCRCRWGGGRVAGAVTRAREGRWPHKLVLGALLGGGGGRNHRQGRRGHGKRRTRETTLRGRRCHGGFARLGSVAYLSAGWLGRGLCRGGRGVGGNEREYVGGSGKAVHASYILHIHAPANGTREPIKICTRL
ncbi:hypothetical protein B0H16DRAFT_1494267 [Mycena metata]|uniref:Uncharacterized protein n=1 Tax=Mycena metata TaxID=1033252 RepID=A0AAD7KDY9_9AGAR|nr:hypothetical protein B0H16DRAFT_1494267 [Mycena metata]